MDNGAGTTTSREVCDECGFDAGEWDRASAATQLKQTADRWLELFSGNDRESLHRRPAPKVWSAVEYAVHTARVVEWWSDAIATMVSGGLVHLDMEGYPDADVFPYNDVPAQDAVTDLRSELARMEAWVAGATPDAWTAPFVLDDDRLTRMWREEGIPDAGSGALHALHDALHHLADVERGLTSA